MRATIALALCAAGIAVAAHHQPAYQYRYPFAQVPTVHGVPLTHLNR